MVLRPCPGAAARQHSEAQSSSAAIFYRSNTTARFEGPMTTPASPANSELPCSKRILVVDDDDAVRHGLNDILVTEGYEVVTASNGIQALAALRRQSCDLA